MFADDAPRSEYGLLIGIFEGREQLGDFFYAIVGRKIVGGANDVENFTGGGGKNVLVEISDELTKQIFVQAARHELRPGAIVDNRGDALNGNVALIDVGAVNHQRQANRQPAQQGNEFFPVLTSGVGVVGVAARIFFPIEPLSVDDDGFILAALDGIDNFFEAIEGAPVNVVERKIFKEQRRIEAGVENFIGVDALNLLEKFIDIVLEHA